MIWYVVGLPVIDMHMLPVIGLYLLSLFGNPAAGVGPAVVLRAGMLSSNLEAVVVVYVTVKIIYH